MELREPYSPWSLGVYSLHYPALPLPMGTQMDSTQGNCEVNPQEGPAPG